MPTPPLSLPFIVRPVIRGDLPAVGRLAAQLLRYHHALDPNRFFLHEPVEEGYTRFLASEMDRPGVVLLVAERIDEATDMREIVGYTYGRLEPQDFNMLLDAHGALHDVLVALEARGTGVGEELVRETCRRLQALGAARVVLHTAVQNAGAQALFEKVGFRRTMIEMTRENE